MPGAFDWVGQLQQAQGNNVQGQRDETLPNGAKRTQYANGETAYVLPDGRVFNQAGYNEHLNAENKKIETQKLTEEMKKQGLNADGSPIAPEFQSLVDPTTGQLKKDFQLNIQQYDPNSSEGYKKFKGEALRTGPSAWANLQMQKQQMEQQDAQGAAARQGLSSLNQGFSSLAQKGGLGVGSRTRLAAQGMKDLLAQRQQVNRQGISNRLGIQTTDEENRQKQLSQLMGTDTDLGKYNTTIGAKQSEFNMNTLLQDKQAKDSFATNKYTEQQKKWAAERQAQATERSSGGGGK
jgi:hypothetical protein